MYCVRELLYTIIQYHTVVTLSHVTCRNVTSERERVTEVTSERHQHIMGNENNCKSARWRESHDITALETPHTNTRLVDTCVTPHIHNEKMYMLGVESEV